MIKIKKKLFILLGIIIVLVALIFTQCNNTIELGFDTWSIYENDISNFKDNRKSFDCIIDIILKEKSSESDAYEFSDLNKYTKQQQNQIKKAFDFYDDYYHEKPDFWQCEDNMIYYQDGRAAYRLVYSVDKNKPQFESNDFGYWKGTRINKHWYFYAYVYK